MNHDAALCHSVFTNGGQGQNHEQIIISIEKPVEIIVKIVMAFMERYSTNIA